MRGQSAKLHGGLYSDAVDSPVPNPQRRWPVHLRVAWEAATASQTSDPRPPEEHGPPASAGGTRSAFSELYEAHADRVYRYLLSRTDSQADAEELTSRTFLNAFANLEGYRGRGRGFSSWLMTIAHNLLANWYRDRGRRPRTTRLDEAIGVATDVPGPESRLEASELSRLVRDAVEELAPDRQQLIALKYVDGLSNAEIGRIMGRTESAVKSLHHRTLRQLHGALSEAGQG